MTKLRHYDNLNTARFITFSCYHHFPLLRTETAIHSFIDILKIKRKEYGFKILGYVIMPSHVHLVIHPNENDNLGKMIGVIKSLSARDILRYWQEKNYTVLLKSRIIKDGKEKYAFWQKRFYDFNCRTEGSVVEKINYCHNNPVKAGLANNPEDWKWSSYRWYNGLDDVVLEIDGVAL
jgi:putative transposase